MKISILKLVALTSLVSCAGNQVSDVKDGVSDVSKSANFAHTQIVEAGDNPLCMGLYTKILEIDDAAVIENASGMPRIGYTYSKTISENSVFIWTGVEGKCEEADSGDAQKYDIVSNTDGSALISLNDQHHTEIKIENTTLEASAEENDVRWLIENKEFSLSVVR